MIKAVGREFGRSTFDRKPLNERLCVNCIFWSIFCLIDFVINKSPSFVALSCKKFSDVECVAIVAVYSTMYFPGVLMRFMNDPSIKRRIRDDPFERE